MEKKPKCTVEEKIVRSVVLHSCFWKPEKFSRDYKNGIVDSHVV